MGIDSEIKPDQIISAEEWRDKLEEVKSLREEIMDLTDEIFGDEHVDGISKAAIEEDNINRRIIKRFTEKELLKYGAWHAFIGSGVSKEDCDAFDMPGNEIEKSIREEIKRLKESKK